MRVRAALFSPNSGIVEAEGLVRALARLCGEHDAFVLTGSPLTGADSGTSCIELRTPAETIRARSVVNAAGLYADDVSATLGGESFRLPVPGSMPNWFRRGDGVALQSLFYRFRMRTVSAFIFRRPFRSVTLGPTRAIRIENDYEAIGSRWRF